MWSSDEGTDSGLEIQLLSSIEVQYLVMMIIPNLATKFTWDFTETKWRNTHILLCWPRTSVFSSASLPDVSHLSYHSARCCSRQVLPDVHQNCTNVWFSSAWGEISVDLQIMLFFSSTKMMGFWFIQLEVREPLTAWWNQQRSAFLWMDFSGKETSFCKQFLNGKYLNKHLTIIGLMMLPISLQIFFIINIIQVYLFIYF